MYLTQILDVDPSWLGEGEGLDEEADDDTCLAYLHRLRTIRLLQEVRVRVGAEVFENVWRHFDSVRNAGFDLDDILFTDTSSFIDRGGWADEEEEEEDAEEDEEEEARPTARRRL